MITTTTKALYSCRVYFETLGEIAQEATGRDPVEVVRNLETLAARGAHVTLMFDSGALIGSYVFGHNRLFLDWFKDIDLVMVLQGLGHKDISMASHIYLRKAYWKQGLHTRLSVDRARAALELGFTHALLCEAATDQLQAWVEKQPSTHLLKDVTDRNGRAVGIVDFAVLTEIKAE